MKTEEDLSFELTIYYMKRYNFFKTVVFLLGLICMSLFATLACTTVTNHYNYYSDYTLSENYNESIAFAMVHFGGEAISQGTAFAIDEDYLLTAGHICIIEEAVIEDSPGLEIKMQAIADKVILTKISKYGWWQVGSNIVATVHKISPDKDVCILKSEDHGLRPLELLENMEAISSGDAVSVIGCPKGIPYVKEYGTIVHYNVKEQEIRLNARIEGGSSGSPVLWNGRVIGLAYAYLTKEPVRRITLAVSSDYLVEFTKENIEGFGQPSLEE